MTGARSSVRAAFTMALPESEYMSPVWRGGMFGMRAPRPAFPASHRSRTPRFTRQRPPFLAEFAVWGQAPLTRSDQMAEWSS